MRFHKIRTERKTHSGTESLNILSHVEQIYKADIDDFGSMNGFQRKGLLERIKFL